MESKVLEQFVRWNLTETEKTVALLLLKGLSLAEIAKLRNTKEKTVRAQAVQIYQKSGVTSRSEFSGHFIRKYLLP
jgi:DNA-binding NarL/FixJ family response regulator